MRYGRLIIERKEYERVKKILLGEVNQDDVEQRVAIRKLLDELKMAEVLPEAEMPEDVVRLNSTVKFKMPDLNMRRFKIVIPKESDVSQKRLSLLSPMGLALFGYAKGDAVEWQFPSGTRTIDIVEVEQESDIYS